MFIFLPLLQVLAHLAVILLQIFIWGLRLKELSYLGYFGLVVGFPDSSVGKESTCNAGDPGSIPRLGRSAGEGKKLPTPLFWPGELHGVTKSWTGLSDFCFPHSSVGKESTCNAGDPSLILGSERSTGEGIGYPLQYSWASLVAQLVKNPLAMQETWVRSLGWEDTLEKGKATHSGILAWRIPWIV